MKRMTLEEASALDKLLTETDPEFTNIPGVFARERDMLAGKKGIHNNYSDEQLLEIIKDARKTHKESI